MTEEVITVSRLIYSIVPVQQSGEFRVRLPIINSSMPEQVHLGQMFYNTSVPAF